jgi:hypothetical protein
MPKALAEGETDAPRLAALADPKLHATPEQLQDALCAAAGLSALHRQILGLFLTRLELIEHQIEILDRSWDKPSWPTRRLCCAWPRCPVTASIRPSR